MVGIYIRSHIISLSHQLYRVPAHAHTAATANLHTTMIRSWTYRRGAGMLLSARALAPRSRPARRNFSLWTHNSSAAAAAAAAAALRRAKPLPRVPLGWCPLRFRPLCTTVTPKFPSPGNEDDHDGGGGSRRRRRPCARGSRRRPPGHASRRSSSAPPRPPSSIHSATGTAR